MCYLFFFFKGCDFYVRLFAIKKKRSLFKTIKCMYVYKQTSNQKKNNNSFFNWL